jgi:DNA-binding transcriptional ArsR family regulator
MASDGVRTLSTEQEISAYLHRTRMAILEALRAGPATVTQVSGRLGVHPANLTRHVRVLEAAGLVVLVEKRDTGRNLEKYYAATAVRFAVAPDTSGLRAPHVIALTFARSLLSAALARLPDREQDPLAALTVAVRLTEQTARAFADELTRLAERFSATDEGEGRPYEIVLALVPGEDHPDAEGSGSGEPGQGPQAPIRMTRRPGGPT